MGFVSSLLNGLFDVLLMPFGSLPPVWGLLFLSIASGLGMISVFKLVSDQEKIAFLRRRMGGEILGILLHVSSPSTVLRFAGRLIWSNTRYLLLLLKPLLVIAIPFMLVWGQLDARYSSAGAGEDDRVTVTVQFAEKVPPAEDIRLEVSGAELLPPIMVIDTLEQSSFRLETHAGGPASISVNGVETRFGAVRSRWGSIVHTGFETSPSPLVLFTPRIEIVEGSAEGPLSGWYALPGTHYTILGWHWSWAAVFLVFSMAAALAGARFMRVRI